MENKFKVILVYGSSSGSNGFLRDAPRTSMTPDDPVLVARGSLVEYLRSLQLYRGMSGLSPRIVRDEPLYFPVHLGHLYRGHPSEAFFYLGVLR